MRLIGGLLILSAPRSYVLCGVGANLKPLRNVCHSLQLGRKTLHRVS